MTAARNVTRIRIENIKDRTISFCENLLDHADLTDPVEIASCIERMIDAVEEVINPLHILAGVEPSYQRARTTLRELHVTKSFAWENVDELEFDELESDDKTHLMNELVRMLDDVAKGTGEVINCF